MQPVKLYYSSFANFGDALNAALFARLSGVRVVHCSPHEGDVMGVGSIFYGGGFFWGSRGSLFSKNRARALYRRWKNIFRGPMNVWGSGILFDLPVPEDVVVYRPMCIHAIRGRETERVLKRVGILSRDAHPALGDPGLFYPDLVEDLDGCRKEYELAIVPHYTDYKLGLEIGDTLKKRGVSVRVVDVMQPDPQNVIREIASARKALSASLHGLIVADSMGIPNQHLLLSDYEVDRHYGAGACLLKFRDYYSAYGRVDHAPITVDALLENSAGVIDAIGSNCISRESVLRVKAALLAAFPEKYRGKAFPAFCQKALRRGGNDNGLNE